MADDPLRTRRGLLAAAAAVDAEWRKTGRWTPELAAHRAAIAIALGERLIDESRRARRSAAHCLRRIARAEPAWQTLRAALLRDPDPGVRREAVIGVGRCCPRRGGVARAVPAVLALRDADPSVRWQAARELGRLLHE